MENRILILDYGLQFTQLIARRIREVRVYCEIHPPTVSLEWIREFAPRGIVLSGGPSSVYSADAPPFDPAILSLDVPVLGICYGMQLIAQANDARVIPGRGEHGRAEVRVHRSDELFYGFETADPVTVGASHGDHINEAPTGFEVLASTQGLHVAAFRQVDAPRFGALCHPEVAHTPRGGEVIYNFVFRICGCEPTWPAPSLTTRSRAFAGRSVMPT